MNKVSTELTVIASHMNGQTARVIVFVLSLALFVLAAGAPDAGGTIGLR
jgi:hypothetical protein